MDIKNNCQNKNNVFLWRKAMLPVIFSFCAFICFTIVYWLVTARAINPLYFLGLIFLLPCLSLALVAWLAGKDKLSKNITVIYTFVIVPASVIISLFLILIISFNQSSVIVRDVSRYERTMKLIDYTKKEHLAIFPEKIPIDAKNIDFYYDKSQWMEYSQTVVLQFSSDQKTIGNYVEKIEQLAIQEDNTDYSKIFDRVGDDYIEDLPSDYAVYVIINEGSHDRKVCAVSVSTERNDIIFYAYEMRW